VLVAHDAVAGVEPEVAPGLDRLLRQAVVAERERERLVAAHHHLAGRSRWHLLVVLIDDARVVARRDGAHRPGRRALVRSRDDEVRLARAPAVDDPDPEAALEGLVQGGRRCGGERDAHRVLRLVRIRIALPQDVHHRSEQVGDGRLRLDEAPPELRRREARADRHRRAVDERLRERVQRVRVEERQVRVEDIALDDVEDPARLDRPPVPLRVRAEDALRRARRARRVEDERRVARPGRTTRRGIGLLWEVAVQHAARLRHAVRVLEERLEPGLEHEQLRPGVPEHV